MKRKNILKVGVLLLILAMTFAFAGCGGSSDEEEPAEEAAIEEEVEAEAEDETALSDGSEYGYSGTDPIEAAVFQYLAEVVSDNYDDYDVCIPSASFIGKDDSNPDDILITGFFFINNFNIDGDTLVFTSGGDHSGCMHVTPTGDGAYAVLSFDPITDGEGYAESAKEIFGDDYDAFMTIEGDQVAKEAILYEAVTTYVNTNEVPCDKFQTAPDTEPVGLHI